MDSFKTKLGKYQDLYKEDVWDVIECLPCTESDLDRLLKGYEIKYPFRDTYIVSITVNKIATKVPCLSVYLSSHPKSEEEAKKIVMENNKKDS